jgi:hypothetical protein
MNRKILIQIMIVLTVCLSCTQPTLKGKSDNNSAFICRNCDSIIDSVSGNKFYLDSSKIFITAVDSKGKLLWKTDPWKDNNLMEYRVNRPIIVYFNFASSKDSAHKKEIGISYNNSQFGRIELISGKFTFRGQD